MEFKYDLSKLLREKNEANKRKYKMTHRVWLRPRKKQIRREKRQWFKEKYY